MMKKAVAEKRPAQPVYGKAQLLRADKYANRRDMLSVLLEDDRKYTVDEVDRLIRDFLKRKVK